MWVQPGTLLRLGDRVLNSAPAPINRAYGHGFTPQSNECAAASTSSGLPSAEENSRASCDCCQAGGPAGVLIAPEPIGEVGGSTDHRGTSRLLDSFVNADMWCRRYGDGRIRGRSGSSNSPDTEVILGDLCPWRGRCRWQLYGHQAGIGEASRELCHLVSGIPTVSCLCSKPFGVRDAS